MEVITLNEKNLLLLKLLVFLLIIEKIAQHFITAYFFAFGDIKPDIGTKVNVDDNTMAIFNSIYTLLFIISLIAFLISLNYRLSIVIALAALDIILEFIFHGFGFITISVLVSIILIIFSVIFFYTSKSSETFDSTNT